MSFVWRWGSYGGAFPGHRDTEDPTGLQVCTPGPEVLCRRGVTWLGAFLLVSVAWAQLVCLPCLEELKREQFLWGVHIPGQQLLAWARQGLSFPHQDRKLQSGGGGGDEEPLTLVCLRAPQDNGVPARNT